MEKFKYIPKERIAQLPKDSGVYVFRNNKKFLYIGKATNIRERVKNHFSQPAYRDNLFINQVSKIGYLKTNSEIEAVILEANLIKKYQPKYNVIWRDDKNYFFVIKTKEEFPRIFITHQPKSLLLIRDDRHLSTNFVGPFVDGKALKQTLKVLRKVFPYRSCKTLPNRPCLWYHLGRCPAPCLLKPDKSSLLRPVRNFSEKSRNLKNDKQRFLTGLRSTILSARMAEEIKKVSQRNAKNLIKILREGKSRVLKNLKREMKLAAKNQDFEEAAKIRDQIEALERVMEHTKIFEAVDVRRQHEGWGRVQRVLQKILKTRKKISRIEAYDVSNIQGQEATGSMVTFINNQPDKNFYRKFKIKISGKPDDIAMLKECLIRRFKHPEWGLPDLILIDGGRAQLNAALKCANSKFAHIKVMALAKKKNELFIENQKEPILLKNLPREIFNLILQLRDEAHRFAISYHKKLRTEALLKE